MSDTVHRYALVGKPIAHSASPRIHQAFAAGLGLSVTYDLLEPAGREFAPLVQDFFAGGGKGMNVTMPFKEAVLGMVDDLSNIARLAGAANTLRAEADGTISACNTDGAGLVTDLKRRWHMDPAGKAVLVIGAGGAAAGILGPLLACRPARLCVANRTPARAAGLVTTFAATATGHGSELRAAGLDTMACMAPYQLVINTVGVGKGGAMPQYPPALFAGVELAYEVSYGPMVNAGFVQVAKAAGVTQVVDGLGMVVEQAALSFAYWEGQMPATDPVYAMLGQ